MHDLRYIDDIIDWLEPMDYAGFWHVIAPYDLALPARESCDRQIASGEVAGDLVLDGLKYLARAELAERHGLEWRPATPWLKLVS